MSTVSTLCPHRDVSEKQSQKFRRSTVMNTFKPHNQSHTRTHTHTTCRSSNHDIDLTQRRVRKKRNGTESKAGCAEHAGRGNERGCRDTSERSRKTASPLVIRPLQRIPEGKGVRAGYDRTRNENEQDMVHGNVGASPRSLWPHRSTSPTPTHLWHPLSAYRRRPTQSHRVVNRTEFLLRTCGPVNL